ncbi:MAG: cell surface protein [Rikenellaceae bacterium]|nr:cell surface protein [Rikenellaceae bacterium]MCL2693324.1 cell surface protein [Rikenellaceae bacterium]
MNRYLIRIALVAALVAAGCNESDRTEVIPPEIIFTSETGVYQIKTGGSITLDPQVKHIDEVTTFEWSINGEVLAATRAFTFTPPGEGRYYLLFRVRTRLAENEQEVRIDVGPLAPPMISFMIPGGVLDVRADEEYTIEPFVQNADEEEATFEWRMDGEIVGAECTYTFRLPTAGEEHTLSLEVVNEDGTDVKTLTIRVHDEVPRLRVWFEQPYYGGSADAPVAVFADRTTYFAPSVEGDASGVEYRWSVDGGPQGGGAAKYFAFTPPASGTYRLEVQVYCIDSERIIASAGIDVESLGNEHERMRAMTGESRMTAAKVLEYLPAPGQFINEPGSGQEYITTMAEACRWAEQRLDAEDYVSLGGFGGYITVWFDHSIPNTGDYDFAIAGNQYEGSSEPGVVWVAQDVNGNGVPDGMWYELRGSETGKPETVQDYAVTYFRPGAWGDTPWRDNRGAQGVVPHLPGFHRQHFYYPAWVCASEYTLRGTSLAPRNFITQGGQWVNGDYDWGYVDNVGSDMFRDAGTSGGDAVYTYFKISNAMNADGSPANLQYIDFIKVQTAVNASSGWLGEISTEVLGFKNLNFGN